ncbi:zinc ribbon domain-containing protein [Candidatus Thorarchaeota archaeon]|nr:MAG: zinc ribbon domain-containing protein [Candidatus Thorarchaeota archaeon]
MRKGGFLISLGTILVIIGFIFLMVEGGSVDTFFFVFPFFFFAGSSSPDFMIILLVMIFLAFTLFFFCIPLRWGSRSPRALDYEHQAEIQEYCPYCHSRISNDAIYCHKCGERVVDSE